MWWGGIQHPFAEWRNGGPHLQDAPPLVLLVLREHISGEECIAVKADAVGPVVIILEFSPVVRAPGTHHLEEDRQEGLGASGEAGEDCVSTWASEERV